MSQQGLPEVVLAVARRPLPPATFLKLPVLNQILGDSTVCLVLKDPLRLFRCDPLHRGPMSLVAVQVPRLFCLCPPKMTNRIDNNLLTWLCHRTDIHERLVKVNRLSSRCMHNVNLVSVTEHRYPTQQPTPYERM